MTTALIVLATIAFYFALLFVISWITGHKADNAGFFTGNRKSPWYMVTIAMIGARVLYLQEDTLTCKWFLDFS